MAKEIVQRVRIGLTGLSCVFLLVLLAAAFFGLSNDDPVGPSSSGGQIVSGSAAPDSEAPREPLAELGVTPGNVPEKEAPSPAAKSDAR